MTEPDHREDELEDDDGLTDEEVAELDAASAEAQAHPETVIPHAEVMRRRAKDELRAIETGEEPFVKLADDELAELLRRDASALEDLEAGRLIPARDVVARRPFRRAG